MTYPVRKTSLTAEENAENGTLTAVKNNMIRSEYTMKYITYDQLPLMLNAEDVQAVMNISRAGAYQLMHREDFPVILIGKRMVVPRDKFLEWVEKNVKQQVAGK